MAASSESEFDVVVIGAGGSGLAAAIAAAEAGGRVVVLEKRPEPGGTTGIAVGSFTASGTRQQREKEVSDSSTDHAADAGRFPPADIESRNNSELRAWFLQQTADTLAWLEKLGLAFSGPYPEPPNRVPRLHQVVPGGKAYITTMFLTLRNLGGTIVCNAIVEQLLRDGAGRVIGAEAFIDGQPRRFMASRGVILATGDYTNNSALIAEHKGEGFRGVEGINPHSTGDGHRMAAEVGVELVNMDVTYGPELRFIADSHEPFKQWLPGEGGWLSQLVGAVVPHLPNWVTQEVLRRMLVTWQHPENALFADGAILVNREGARFVNEKASPDREIAIAEQVDKIAYLLLDARLIKRYSAWPHYVSTAPDIAYAYVADYQRLRPDVTTTGVSLQDLCDRRGLDADRLEASVAAFNRYVAGQQTDPFRRTGDKHKLEGGPWVLLGPVKAFFTTTEGGAAINSRLQCLDGNGEPIHGLYAVGQVGLGGMILWGHGLHIAWAMTSGRLAGELVMRNGDS